MKDGKEDITYRGSRTKDKIVEFMQRLVIFCLLCFNFVYFTAYLRLIYTVPDFSNPDEVRVIESTESFTLSSFIFWCFSLGLWKTTHWNNFNWNVSISLNKYAFDSRELQSNYPFSPKRECIKQMSSCKTDKIGGHFKNYLQIPAIWNVFAASENVISSRSEIAIAFLSILQQYIQTEIKGDVLPKKNGLNDNANKLESSFINLIKIFLSWSRITEIVVPVIQR